MLVVGLEHAEDCAVHFRLHTVVGAEEYAVLIFNKELACRARGMSSLSHACSDVNIHIGILVQHRTQARPVVRHVQVVTSDEDGVGVLANCVLKGSHQSVVAQAVGGIYVPCSAVRQTVVGLIHRQVHPDRLSDMDADWHLQLTAFLDERFDARIIDVDILAFHGTCIEVALAFVTKFAYANSAHLMVTLQGLNRLGQTFGSVDVGIVKAAPQTETVLVRSVCLYHFLKRATNPRAMHDSGVQYAYRVHHVDPLLDILCALCIVMRVHVDNREFGFLDIRHGDVVNYCREIILNQDLIGIGCLVRFGRVACGHHEKGRYQKYELLLHVMLCVGASDGLGTGAQLGLWLIISAAKLLLFFQITTRKKGAIKHESAQLLHMLLFFSTLRNRKDLYSMFRYVSKKSQKIHIFRQILHFFTKSLAYIEIYS